MTMRIAIIGSGSVGCFYGARLARVGHDVHFLMRRDYEAVRDRGLQVNSCDGDFHIAAQAHRESDEIGEVDLVICALKATAMDVAEALIQPCVGKRTRILALMNGLGIEEQFAQWFGPERIFGGMAFVCINRGEPGIVHHLAYGRVAFGHLQDDLKAAGELAELFQQAGITSDVRPSLKQARWEKLMWNIPYSTLAITAGAVTTKEIVEDSGLEAMARTLMFETAHAGNADGCNIDVEGLSQKLIQNTSTMDAYRPSMLIDYLNKTELEVEAILGEPVRRAHAVGFDVPTIEAQYRLTRFLDLLNRGVVQSS
jgi:2-dehydropantoate 2-reductase